MGFDLDTLNMTRGRCFEVDAASSRYLSRIVLRTL